MREKDFIRIEKLLLRVCFLILFMSFFIVVILLILEGMNV